jgi:hypothetical protein
MMLKSKAPVDHSLRMERLLFRLGWVEGLWKPPGPFASLEEPSGASDQKDRKYDPLKRRLLQTTVSLWNGYFLVLAGWRAFGSFWEPLGPSGKLRATFCNPPGEDPDKENPRPESRSEQSRAKQCRPEQGRAKQGKADQSRAEQCRSEQSRAEQSRAEQSRAEQSRAEQSTAEQSRPMQSRADTPGLLELFFGLTLSRARKTP